MRYLKNILTHISNYVTTVITKLVGAKTVYNESDMTNIETVQSLEKHLEEIAVEKPKPRRGRPKKDK
jgi:hypothetical protein